MWCIGSINGQYIARMEGVLDFYNKEVESGVVRLAFDERPCQLLANKIEPLPMESGKSKRIDSEYEKKGTCNLHSSNKCNGGIKIQFLSEKFIRRFKA